MKKSALIGLLSVFAVASVPTVYAQGAVTVNVTGTVNTTTCDVSANTQNINLGNAKPADFAKPDQIVESTKQQFSISLANCSGAGAGQAQLKVTGPVTGAGNNYFSKDPSSVVAVSLWQDKTEIANNGLINMGAANADDAALNNLSTPFVVGLKSSTANPAGGVTVEAPLTFSFVYN